MVRSLSRDSDILALLVACDLAGFQDLIDKGTGIIRKIIDATSSALDLKKGIAFIGFHAFSGIGYVSNFSGKEKEAVRGTMIKKADNVNLFANLGTTLRAS